MRVGLAFENTTKQASHEAITHGRYYPCETSVRVSTIESLRFERSDLSLLHYANTQPESVTRHYATATVMVDLSIEPGACDVCRQAEAVYRCPGCRQRTCSLQCVQQHKKATGCSAQRDRTTFVATSQLTERHFHQDIAFLHDGSRRVGQAARHVSSVAETAGAAGRRRLQRVAATRGVTLRLMPDGMSRQRENTSQCSSGRDPSISWRIELMFPHAGNLRYTEGSVDDTTCLGDLLDDLVSRDELAAPLAWYAERRASLALAMRVEGRPANAPAYYRMARDQTLRQALDGTTVLEFPSLHVLCLPDDDQHYPVHERAVIAAATAPSPPSAGASPPSKRTRLITELD